jgi:class I fructose-bisphosphate aldolase
MSPAGLINSGGESGGESDLADEVKAAVINKRSRGIGLILGRNAFKRPMPEGIKILNAVQDVFLCDDITIA